MSLCEHVDGRGPGEVLRLYSYYTELSVSEYVGCRGNVEVLGLCNYNTERFLYKQVGGQVMWRFEGYITTTQSGFSMNRWVHGQGTVDERERTRKTYSPKERGNILTCLLLVSTSSSFFTACSSHQQPFYLFLPENGLF